MSCTRGFLPIEGRPRPRSQAERTSDRKERLLRAAAVVIRQGGVQTLTLDAVAREAGTSKGGLLYHFHGKSALLESLLQSAIDRLRNEMVRLAQDDPDPHGRQIRAYIRALGRPVPNDDGFGPTIVAALLFDPLLAQRWRAFTDRWLEPDGTVSDAIQAGLLRMVADGHWLSVAFGLHPVCDEQRTAVLQRLFELIRQ